MLIALTGLKRSGKDTVADVLVEYGFERVAFAGPLKGMIKYLLECTGMSATDIDFFMNGDGKETPLDVLQGKSARFAMQTLGTEWRNFLGKDLWTDIIKAKVEVTPDVVITDMRFLHEEEFAEEYDGTKVRVVRAGQPPSADLHPSEQEMSAIEADITLYNYGTLAEIQLAARILHSISMGVYWHQIEDIYNGGDL